MKLFIILIIISTAFACKKKEEKTEESSTPTIEEIELLGSYQYQNIDTINIQEYITETYTFDETDTLNYYIESAWYPSGDGRYCIWWIENGNKFYRETFFWGGVPIDTLSVFDFKYFNTDSFKLDNTVFKKINI